MSTYIELVNTAIDEAKVSLDPLTPDTFDDPPRTAMYSRFKRWINDAYIELLSTRNEWFSRKERGIIDIGPRIMVYDVALSPEPGYVYRGAETGIEFEVTQIHSIESNAGALRQTAVLSIALRVPEDSIHDIPQGEVYDLVSPSTFSGAMKFKGFGFYDLVGQVGNAEHIDHRSIHMMPTDIEYLDSGDWRETPVTYIQWDALHTVKGNHTGRLQGGTATTYVTRTPRGDYYFHPPLERNMLLSFDYTRSYTDMVHAEDEPVGIPSQYRAWLVWRAIMAYGDFQQNGAIWSRGDRNAEKIMNRMERDLAPEVRIGGNIW